MMSSLMTHRMVFKTSSSNVRQVPTTRRARFREILRELTTEKRISCCANDKCPLRATDH